MDATHVVPANRIDPEGVYSPRSLATITATGPQTWYRAVRAGKCRAAKLNDRGDLRILGAWALAFMEAQAVEIP